MAPAAATLALLIGLAGCCFCCCHCWTQPEASAAATSQPQRKQQANASTAAAAAAAEGVDEILKDTLELLDSLDQRLAVVSNRTAGAGKLRSLTAAASQPQQQSHEDETLLLTSLAEGFSSERHTVAAAAVAATGDLTAAASNQAMAATGSAALPAAQATQHDDTLRTGRAASDEPPTMGAMAATSTGNQGGGRFDNDFTERHIRFSLDLMRAVFAGHTSGGGVGSGQRNVDSFLISPVSLQLVLMMMHLGARGATKRELSHALHLLDSSPVALVSPPLSHLNNEVGASSSSSSSSKPAGANSTNVAALLKTTNNTSSSSNSSSASGKNAKLTRRHQASSGGGKPAAGPQLQTQNTSSRHSQQQQAHQANQNVNNVNPQQQLNNVHEQFGAALRQLLRDPSVAKALTSANQIFLQRDLPLAPHYEWAAKHYYGAELRQVDFQNQQQQQQEQNASGSLSSAGGQQANSTQQQGVQQLINEWVERQTRGKITNFLGAPVPTSTLLMALNVLFFKGDWQYKFDPQDTDPEAWFTRANGRSLKLPMMVNKLPLAHAHDPALRAAIIELPYRAQRLGLFVLLPDEQGGIFDTMQMLNSSSFANLISLMRKPPSSAEAGGGGGINVRIPKFSIESAPRMSQILSQQLGLKSLFAPDQADLSGMFANSANNSTTTTSRLAQVGLDELLHKAVLQVHEQGSVAAAASATIVERVGLFNGQYFEADHPFLVFLMDKQTGLVLFSGVFAGPPDSNAGQEVAQQQQQTSAANATSPAPPPLPPRPSRNPK